MITAPPGLRAMGLRHCGGIPDAPRYSRRSSFEFEQRFRRSDVTVAHRTKPRVVVVDAVVVVAVAAVVVVVGLVVVVVVVVVVAVVVVVVVVAVVAVSQVVVVVMVARAQSAP